MADRRTLRQKLEAMSKQTIQSPNEAAIAKEKLAEMAKLEPPKPNPHTISFDVRHTTSGYVDVKTGDGGFWVYNFTKNDWERY